MKAGLKASVTALVLGAALFTTACSRQDQTKAKETVDQAAKSTEKALDTAGDKAKEAWDKTKDAAKDAADSNKKETTKPSAAKPRRRSRAD